MLKTENNSPIYKICLTGGPNAGKTTAVTAIIEKYGNEFTIYRVPNLSLINSMSGILMHSSEFVDDICASFVETQIQAQINIEKYYETIATIQKRPVLLIITKGTMDYFVECSENVKERVLNTTGWNYNYLMNNRYDMVIHMLIKGINEILNTQRMVSMESIHVGPDVKDIDSLIRHEWIEHPNYRVVDNSNNSYIKKIQIVIQKVSQLIQMPSVEYVRKFLLKKVYKPSDLPNYIVFEQHTDRITYLIRNDHETINWVVKRTYSNNPTVLYLRYNRKLSNRESIRFETCKVIPEKVYYDCLGQSDPKLYPVQKKIIGFYFEKNNKTLKYLIENIEVNNETVSLLRVYGSSDNQLDVYVPEFLDVGDDVSDNEIFNTYNLSKIK